MTRERGNRGVWGHLADAAERPSSDGEINLWEQLAERVSLAAYKPKLAEDIEVKNFSLRWGNDYTMISNPRDLTHYRLGPGEAELLPLLDGTRTVNEIVVERFQDSGDLELSGVADLVRLLRETNFLDRRFLDVYGAVRRSMTAVSRGRATAREFARTLSVEWQDADRLVAWFYRNLLRPFFRRGPIIVASVLAVAGFAAFMAAWASGRFALGQGSLVAESLILLALNYFLTFVHELGHAVVLTHHGRRVKSAGFMIYFGSPAFFVDASDGLMMERKDRMVQSFAGPFAELIVAGLASFFVWTFPDSGAAFLLYKFALLNYFVIFLNLVPLLELDGYWILSDLIQVPDLRPMSLTFIRYDLWRKLRQRERFTKQEVGLALYGILGVAFSVFVVYVSFFFWEEVFGGLVTSLWNGGPLLRLLLIALAVFVAGPLLRGLISLGRSIGRRIRAIWRQVRFKLETGWRVEAAGLIDALPIFDDVPEDVLSDLAGRVRLRSFPRGKPVVRQGERASAFYLVRRGTLQVVEEDPASGDERVLRVLGRGESFGELGLLEAAPRTATVRALEDAEVFEIDKGTFERLLADMIHVPEFAPTFQAITELRQLPCFQHLEPDELAELLRHGEWINVTPGEEIVTEGEEGDAFYAIGSGRVDVVEKGEHRRSLGPGDYFGEIALLSDIPRTATVIAKTPVRAFRLDREGFEQLVSGAFRGGTLKPATGADRTWQH